MGTSNSVMISSAVLRKSYLGTIQSENEEVDVYYKPKDCIFTLPKETKIDESQEDQQIKCKEMYKYESFLTLDHQRDFTNNSLSFKYLDEKHKSIQAKTFHFTTEKEYKQAFSILGNINPGQRDGKQRYLGIIVNPISGSKKSVDYFENVFKPVLECAGLKYDVFQTTGPTYIQNLIKDIDLNETPYTDFIVIGGDGTIFQLINSCENHPQKESLRKIPLGFFPGGSTNVISCDLGCTNEYLSTSKILKGDTIQTDLIVTTLDDGKKVYGLGGFIYGHAEVSVRDSVADRENFGKFRYMIRGVQDFFSSIHTPKFPVEISYKLHKPLKQNKEESKQILPILYEKWRKYPLNEIFSMAIIHHECRSTFFSAPLFPGMRYNQGRMLLYIFEPTYKYRMLEFIFKWIYGKGKQVYVPDVTLTTISKIRLSFPTKTFVAVDGEKYETSHCSLELSPHKVNLIGQLWDYKDYEHDVVNYFGF
ncbi:unnamed protein product [Moneuplotes crassus]|uniref:DAGKc domain-containing protein n=1 Tax=Euplotes crassus TaxID=5936 RepID=A0AAD1UIY8_EUPCR|nr:unnamed protein product [Moneuplotes crassus]